MREEGYEINNVSTAGNDGDIAHRFPITRDMLKMDTLSPYLTEKEDIERFEVVFLDRREYRYFIELRFEYMDGDKYFADWVSPNKFIDHLTREGRKLFLMEGGNYL